VVTIGCVLGAKGSFEPLYCFDGLAFIEGFDNLSMSWMFKNNNVHVISCVRRLAVEYAVLIRSWPLFKQIHPIAGFYGKAKLCSTLTGLGIFKGLVAIDRDNASTGVMSNYDKINSHKTSMVRVIS